MGKANFKSIMTKIIFMVIVISIAEAAAFIYMSENLAEHTIENIIDQDSRKNAQLYSEFIGEFFMDRMHEIEIYANSPILKTMDWDQIGPYLKQEYAKYTDIYDNFAIADRDGNYRNSLTDKIGSLKDREHFKAVMAGKTVVSNSIISRTTGNQIVVVATPVKNEKGEVIGMMSGSINLIKLSKIIETLKYNYPGSYSYIVDKNGLTLAHPNYKYIMRENITQKSKVITEQVSKLAAQILSIESGSVKYSLNGVESMNYFHEIPNTDGWKLVIKMPLSYMHNPIIYLRKKMLLIGLLSFLIAVALGYLIAISISKPIVKLKEVFARAEGGDLTARCEISAADEVGETAGSFNRMMDTISRLTFYDPLTNLPNRLMFNSRLKWEIIKADREYGKVAVIIFDIDKFENINNTLGHEAGDRLLKCVADKISGHLKENAFVSRIGDDKFAIMLSGIDSENDAIYTAEELLNLIKQPWSVDKNRFYITAGIGIAFYPKDATDSDNLFRNAYSAMQKAKKTSRDIYELYDKSMNAQLIDQLNLDSSMHYALENGEFSVYYQPQVDAKTREIIGCEALLRWNHPEMGIVPPAKFIPIAETNGLIIPIGEWVLRTACRQGKLWQKQGYKPIHVSINISALQLIQGNFIDIVSDILTETGLAPEYLELEITESVAAKNSEYIAPILKSLRDMGVRIALDDFGIGYSSLNYLKNFPVNNLKIDRNFVQDIDSNPVNASIVSAILTIGHNLMLDVTAEGIETEVQYEILKNGNCDLIQGYLFSEPVPKDEFEKLLKRPAE